jgi:5-methyltetrahydrofolate--homocysteine methyltransferase
MFDYLQAQDINMQLTESYSMFPAASVSGFYFSHPQSHYFNVGKIATDQLQDYKARSGRDEEELRRALGPVLV